MQIINHHRLSRMISRRIVAAGYCYRLVTGIFINSVLFVQLAMAGGFGLVA